MSVEARTDPGDALPEDLLALTAQLVGQPSVSRAEGPFVDWLEAELRSLDHLQVERVGDNLVARTNQRRPQRVVLAGHTDTVPANGNASARIEGDTLWGLGSADMKGGLAIQLALARSLVATAMDVTYVFYAREEVAAAESGLAELLAARPDLVAGDLALIGEPTDGQVEAGCQGTIRVVVGLRGLRAHSARPWMGRNAIHRLGRLLGRGRGSAAAPTGPRRTGVPRGPPGGRRGRGRGGQRRARRSGGHPESPLRAGPLTRGGRGVRPSAWWTTSSRTTTRSRWSTPRPGRFRV